MADSTPITPPAGAGVGRPTASPKRHATDGHSFDAQVHHARHHAQHGPTSHHAGAHHAHAAHHTYAAAAPAPLEPDVRAAIGEAIAREQVPQSWQHGLEFIAAHESGGRVDAQNPHSSARGLFQLTQANYHYNPQGSASFGDPVEEAQGGIRYIRDRYGDIGAAVSTWQKRRAY